jgi:phenylalanyl-tRNA synthetase alpha subunit
MSDVYVMEYDEVIEMATAPIEAQRDDALEALAKAEAERDEMKDQVLSLTLRVGHIIMHELKPVETENGHLHTQVRKLKAEVEELVDAWTRDIEQLERENRLMRQQYDRRVEERDEPLAVLERLQEWGKRADPLLFPNQVNDDLADIIHDANAAVAKAKGGE